MGQHRDHVTIDAIVDRLDDSYQEYSLGEAFKAA